MQALRRLISQEGEEDPIFAALDAQFSSSMAQLDGSGGLHITYTDPVPRTPPSDEERAPRTQALQAALTEKAALPVTVDYDSPIVPL